MQIYRTIEGEIGSESISSAALAEQYTTSDDTPVNADATIVDSNITINLAVKIGYEELRMLFRYDEVKSRTQKAIMQSIRDGEPFSNPDVVAYLSNFVRLFCRCNALPTTYAEDVRAGLATNAEITNFSCYAPKWFDNASEIIRFNVQVVYQYIDTQGSFFQREFRKSLYDYDAIFNLFWHVTHWSFDPPIFIARGSFNAHFYDSMDYLQLDCENDFKPLDASIMPNPKYVDPDDADPNAKQNAARSNFNTYTFRNDKEQEKRRETARNIAEKHHREPYAWEIDEEMEKAAAAAANEANSGKPKKLDDAMEDHAAFVQDNFERSLRLGAKDLRYEVFQSDAVYNNRPDLIQQMLEVIVRKEKPNVALVGDTGVGKSTLIKLLAQAVNNKQVPALLQDTIILELDMMRIVSGTRYRGDFEERLQHIFDEVLKCPKRVILYVDDLGHIISTGGDSESGGNAAAIFASYLRNPKIRLVGTCTQKQYAHVLTKVPAFREISTKIDVPEISDKDIIYEIVENKLNDFESYYKINEDDIEDPFQIVDTTIKYTNKYLPNMHQPSKAVTVLDTAFARATVNEKPVSEEILLEVISDISGVPYTHISTSERNRLSGLAKRVKARVVGQDDAVDAICNAIVANRVGLSDKTKPIANFLFAGSTGVGKTELCKAIAAELFGDEKAIIRVDMSEYGERYSTSNLIGSAKGYVGYNEGGVLTDAVEKKPYSVVLFDEIEKAHPDVLNLLLQIMDDGRLTDTTGKTVDFSNCLVVMTSNLGAKRKGEFKAIGFLTDEAREDTRKADFMDAIETSLSPEFLGRITEIVIFNKLTKENITAIAKSMLNDLVAQTREQGYEVTYHHSLLDYCVEQGYSEESGARPMRNFIHKYVKSYIARCIVNNEVVDNTLALSYSKAEGIHDTYPARKAKQIPLEPTIP